MGKWISILAALTLAGCAGEKPADGTLTSVVDKLPGGKVEKVSTKATKPVKKKAASVTPEPAPAPVDIPGVLIPVEAAPVVVIPVIADPVVEVEVKRRPITDADLLACPDVPFDIFKKAGC